MSFPSQKQIKSLNNTYELIVINDMSIYATKLNNLKYSNASFILFEAIIFPTTPLNEKITSLISMDKLLIIR